VPADPDGTLTTAEAVTADYVRAIEQHARVILRTCELDVAWLHGADGHVHELLNDARTHGYLTEVCRSQAGVVRALNAQLGPLRAVKLRFGAADLAEWRQSVLDAEIAVEGVMSWGGLDANRLHGCGLALTAWAAECATVLAGTTSAAGQLFDLLPRLPGLVDMYGQAVDDLWGGGR
jgi:hypothetical protein